MKEKNGDNIIWKIGKKITAWILALFLFWGLIPAQCIMEDIPDRVMAGGLDGITLSEPRTQEFNYSETEWGKIWDCIYFGSYPQAEVMPSGGYAAVEDEYLQEGDVIEDDELYEVLQSAKEWDSNGDIVIDGEKYHRIKMEDATVIEQSRSGYYNWDGSEEFHFFKYEKIKWRVLQTDGEKALILADKVLDEQKYNLQFEEITWEKSTIRSFLNGYGAKKNSCGVDYSSERSFYDMAFNAEEKSALLESDVIQIEGLYYNQKESNTIDKIFLLSDSEIYGTDRSEAYGFGGNRNEGDRERISDSTTYAKAMGSGCYSSWWLRYSTYSASPMCVENGGSLSLNMIDNEGGVRPAAVLDLKDSSLYSYAGIVDKYGGIEQGEGLGNPKDAECVKYTEKRWALTWDCVYFGSYPQAEVVPAEGYDAIGEKYLKKEDIVKDGGLYGALQSASDWDDKGDIVLDGVKYRRIKKEDAAYAESGNSGQYDWKESDAYHYFKYEPIKWRVLSVEDGKVMLLADKALDGQRFNEGSEDVTWEKSTIRSFLNGYGSSQEQREKDKTFHGDFFDIAFDDKEKAALLAVNVKQSDSLENQSEAARGNDTIDKVFLLSDAEAYGNGDYGFSGLGDNDDWGKRCKSTTYAKAMGISWNMDLEYLGNCLWWLRSPGRYSASAMSIDGCGRADYFCAVDGIAIGVRPSIVLDLKNDDVISYAGVVNAGYPSSMEPLPVPEPVPVPVPVPHSSHEIPKLSDETVKTSIAKATVTGLRSGYTYTGKAIRPSISLMLNGKKLSAKNYTISYENNKTIGMSTITIKGKEPYEGTLIRHFSIVPKGTKVIGISVEKKKMTVKWKKQMEQMDGYEIQYSLKKNMSFPKTIRVGKSKTTTRIVKNLKRGKKYYVRIRTFKKKKGKKFSSAWSEVVFAKLK